MQFEPFMFARRQINFDVPHTRSGSHQNVPLDDGVSSTPTEFPTTKPEAWIVCLCLCALPVFVFVSVSVFLFVSWCVVVSLYACVE